MKHFAESAVIVILSVIITLGLAFGLGACDDGDHTVYMTPVEVCKGHDGVQEISNGYWSGGGDRSLPTVCRDGFAGIAVR